ncbi:MAG: NifU N-terminal domain-containing protein [bacterium]
MDPGPVHYQSTPSPHSMLFHVDGRVTGEKREYYENPDQAASSDLASALFHLDGVATVFLLPTSITVRKSPDADWEVLRPLVVRVIRDHLES